MPRSTVTQRPLVRDFVSALSFPNTTDFVTVPYNASQNVTDNVSAMVWVKPRGFGGINLGNIIKQGTGGFSTGYGLTWRNNTGQRSVRFTGNNGSHDTTLSMIYLQKWLHLAVTYDKAAGSNQVKFYINGILAGVATKSNSLTTDTSDLLIGGDGSRHCDSLLAEMKIYKRTLTAAEILSEYYGLNTSIASIIGHWKMNEGTGSIIVDSSGNQANGTITGAVWSTDKVMPARSVAVGRQLAVGRQAVV